MLKHKLILDSYALNFSYKTYFIITALFNKKSTNYFWCNLLSVKLLCFSSFIVVYKLSL